MNFSGRGRACLTANFCTAMLCFALAAGCSSGGNEVAQKGNAVSQESLENLKLPSAFSYPEGSANRNQRQVRTAEALAGGPETNLDDHPEVQEDKRVQREILVPENVKGKWKAVKLLIKNKNDEKKNETKTVALGSSFTLGSGGITVTVGPFFPNFVMSGQHYTSMNNQLTNPAVQLVVEEGGKQIYKGWAFEKFPTLYSFSNEAFSIHLTGYIPAQVS